MPIQINEPTVIVPCPDCGEKVTLLGEIRLGRQVVCPNCEAELEVVETEPVELDWAYDEYEDDDEDDEDEEW